MGIQWVSKKSNFFRKNLMSGHPVGNVNLTCLDALLEDADGIRTDKSTLVFRYSMDADSLDWNPVGV